VILRTPGRQSAKEIVAEVDFGNQVAAFAKDIQTLPIEFQPVIIRHRVATSMNLMCVALQKSVSYNAEMSNASIGIVAPAREAKVSNRGQMSLPAEARHRWGITDGGEVSIIDLQGALLVVPGTLDEIRDSVIRAVSGGRYQQAVAEIDDPDLAG
jgi:bifunctional DNA-binding transcriptional regulator/antitoxin component of YhaV-PrlF toxin-antitoxin module